MKLPRLLELAGVSPSKKLTESWDDDQSEAMAEMEIQGLALQELMPSKEFAPILKHVRKAFNDDDAANSIERLEDLTVEFSHYVDQYNDKDKKWALNKARKLQDNGKFIVDIG